MILLDTDVCVEILRGNAKVMRRVIRSAYLGEDAGDLSALENPNSIEEIANIRLRS